MGAARTSIISQRTLPQVAVQLFKQLLGSTLLRDDFTI